MRTAAPVGTRRRVRTGWVIAAVLVLGAVAVRWQVGSVFPGGARTTDPAVNLLVAVAVGIGDRMLWAVRVSG